MENMGQDYVSWDELVKESEDTLIRLQSKDQLISEPKEEEKFTKYVPVYSPDKAHKKFIKGKQETHQNRTAGC